jgi:chemotaxis family two-component system response regulator Rcp1
MNSQPIEVLLVEDDPGDIELMEIAFQRSQLRIPLQVVNDGEEALAYLRKEGKFANAVQPDLILLDLNLPGLNGQEVLQKIKADEQLKHIPVVILTTSKAQEEILSSYKLGANAYMTKPVNMEGFATIVKSLDCFWFTVVKFPHH